MKRTLLLMLALLLAAGTFAQDKPKKAKKEKTRKNLQRKRRNHQERLELRSAARGGL